MLECFISVGLWLGFLLFFCFMDPSFHVGKKKKIQEKSQSVRKSLQLYKMSALTVAPFLSCKSVGMTEIDSHGELRPPSALPEHHLQFSFIKTIPQPKLSCTTVNTSHPVGCALGHWCSGSLCLILHWEGHKSRTPSILLWCFLILYS